MSSQSVALLKCSLMRRTLRILRCSHLPVIGSTGDEDDGCSIQGRGCHPYEGGAAHPGGQAHSHIQAPQQVCDGQVQGRPGGDRRR